jgi:hypothetical protein
MKISKFAFAALGTMLSALSVSAASACEDDARLYSIGSFIQETQTGNPEPLKLTSRTFLNLTPKTREALGDRIVVFDKECRPMEVFKGELPVRVEAPFQLLYNAFFDSVLRGDQVTQQVILGGFIAEPLRSVELLGMITPATENQTISEQLATAANIAIHVSNRPAHSCVYGEKGSGSFSAVMLLDVFARFGGKTSDEDSWAASFSASRDEVVDVATSTSFQIVRRERGCLPFEHSATRSSLASVGITVVEAQGGEYVTNKRLQWIKDGRPATPQSLFE